MMLVLLGCKSLSMALSNVMAAKRPHGLRLQLVITLQPMLRHLIVLADRHAGHSMLYTPVQRQVLWLL